MTWTVAPSEEMIIWHKYYKYHFEKLHHVLCLLRCSLLKWISKKIARLFERVAYGIYILGLVDTVSTCRTGQKFSVYSSAKIYWQSCRTSLFASNGNKSDVYVLSSWQIKSPKGTKDLLLRFILSGKASYFISCKSILARVIHVIKCTL